MYNLPMFGTVFTDWGKKKMYLLFFIKQILWILFCPVHLPLLFRTTMTLTLGRADGLTPLILGYHSYWSCPTTITWYMLCDYSQWDSVAVRRQRCERCRRRRWSGWRMCLGSRIHDCFTTELNIIWRFYLRITRRQGDEWYCELGFGFPKWLCECMDLNSYLCIRS